MLYQELFHLFIEFITCNDPERAFFYEFFCFHAIKDCLYTVPVRLDQTSCAKERPSEISDDHDGDICNPASFEYFKRRSARRIFRFVVIAHGEGGALWAHDGGMDDMSGLGMLFSGLAD